MQAHERVAALPIDLERERLADLGLRHARRGDVHHAFRRIALACIGDGDALAACTQERAGIPDLTAAHWVEERAIELDTSFVDGDHACARAFQIGVVSEEELCRHRRYSALMPFSLTSFAHFRDSVGT